MAAKRAERVAVITGGAPGIGAATARLFAAEGARIALVALDEPCSTKPRAAYIASKGAIVSLPRIDSSFTTGCLLFIDGGWTAM